MLTSNVVFQKLFLLIDQILKFLHLITQLLVLEVNHLLVELQVVTLLLEFTIGKNQFGVSFT